MGLISIASSTSTWRGYNYYKSKKVNSYQKISEHEYKGIVSGSNKNNYNVFMDIKHPRKSSCDCPFAKDKRIICKHIVALYFIVFPNEAKQYIEDIERAEEEYETYQEELYDKVVNSVMKMSKSELQESLIDLLSDAPDWLYDRFVREKIGC